MSKISNVSTKILNRKIPNDVFYTPLSVAVKLIEMLEITDTDRVLDPSRGLGVFYDNFPNCNKDWCEITDDRDFFEYNNPVDIIIGNPPFSLWNKWFSHTIKLNPKKIGYVIGCVNLTPNRLLMLSQAGYSITKLHIVSINGWFSNTYLIVFEKNREPIITFTEKSIKN